MTTWYTRTDIVCRNNWCNFIIANAISHDSLELKRHQCVQYNPTVNELPGRERKTDQSNGNTKHGKELFGKQKHKYRMITMHAGPNSWICSRNSSTCGMQTWVGAPPILFAPTNCRTRWFWAKYGKLDGESIRDSYPILHMHEFIDSLGDVTIFYMLDAKSFFGQVKVTDEARDKRTFLSHHGLARFILMPFGLKRPWDVPTCSEHFTILG